MVTSQSSGKTYRVALRGLQPRRLVLLVSRFPREHAGDLQAHPVCAATREVAVLGAAAGPRIPPDRVRRASQYGREIELRLLTPDDLHAAWKQRLAGLLDQPIEDVPRLLTPSRRWSARASRWWCIRTRRSGSSSDCTTGTLRGWCSEIRKNPARHALRTELLKEPLLPYQLDGIAFAVGAGRAVLADDMGLGKTIQGIGVAELLSRVAGVQRVLVVCPTSLKAQWASEIQRFCDRDSQLVVGSAEERYLQYDNGCFFTICNYEQVLRDLEPIERVEVGPDHSRRRPAHQELGSEDIARDQVAAVAIRAGAVGHAAGEPAGRTVLGGAVHRRPAPGARVPLLPPPSHGRRKGQGHRLQEPG